MILCSDFFKICNLIDLLKIGDIHRCTKTLLNYLHGNISLLYTKK